MSSGRTFESIAEAGRGLAGKPLHLAIGMFDGVHLGHRAVIEAAVQSARHAPGACSAVLTFWPHPSAVVNPAAAARLLMDPPAKSRIIFSIGADALVTQRFDREFAAIEAGDFVPHLRRLLPNLVAIYVGENWRFGRGRAGDIGLLLAEGRRHGLTVFSAPRVSLDGEPISSTRIRKAVAEGDVAAAGAMLGFPYFSEGQVLAGKGLGRKIGFPTLNVEWQPQLQPRFGVYEVTVGGAGSGDPGERARVRGVANYGLRPTVENAVQPRLEVHVLGPCPYGPGDRILVEWLRFVRPEIKFADVDALTAQIAQDIASVARRS